MRHKRLLWVGLLGLGVMVGCDDSETAGSGPGGTVVLADLIGTWEASQMVFTNAANPAESEDVIGLGVELWLTVAGDGDYSVVLYNPSEGYEPETGTADVQDGELTVTSDQDPDPVTFSASLSGSTLTLETSGGGTDYDFDEDGTDEAADLRMVLNPQAGTTPGDLAGVWVASVFRFVSEPAQTDTVDAIDMGGSLEITMGDDGRYSVAVTFPPDPTEVIPGTLVIDGNEMVLIDDLGDPLDPMVFSFSFSDNTITLTADDVFDFDEDGVEDPATVEAVLDLQ